MQYSLPAIVGAMEGKDAHTAEQEKVTRERTERIGSQEPTRQRKAWTLRELGGKPLWDWMQLLIVPVVIALVTVAFTLYQEGRQTRIEQQRAENTLKVEAQRAQDVALQDYLDQMGNLLLNEDRPLRQSKGADEVRTLARARTVTVLERMDPSRKGQIVRFLSEAGLVQRVKGEPIIRLDEANLEGANLNFTNLRGANLLNADLDDADLSGVDLSRANLGEADLTDANLRYANLSGAYLINAQGVTNAQLETMAKTLEDATMPDGSQHPPNPNPPRLHVSATPR